MFIESTEQQSLELVAGAVDRVHVEVEGVDRVPHQAVLLIDLCTQGKARQCTQDSAPGRVLAWPHFTKAGSRRE